MHFLYLGPPDVPYHDIGVPGHDSFYHIKMAATLPEIGLVDTFPWLRTTVFNDRFVNHHYGFHVILSPFVHLSHWLTGDYVPGGRWFITVSFGASMALVQLLLMVRRVQFRWAWLVLCLLLPTQFYTRHLFVRAINPSLICMLLLCLCMFTRRFRSAGVVVAVSIHVYLGSVLFAPALVAAMFVAGLLGVLAGDPEGRPVTLRRFWGWKLLIWCTVGWTVGLATHPYGGVDIVEFLKLQVLGSGLTPDIPVGREWKSYTPAWYFVRMCGLTITITLVVLCLRLRVGPKLDADEFALVLINILFLILVLKARRFIEYWPVFATLCAAVVASPIIERVRRPRRDRWPWLTPVSCVLTALAVFLLALFAIRAYFPAHDAADAGARFFSEWKLWSLLAACGAILPITRACASGTHGRATAALWALIAGAFFCGVIAATMHLFAHRIDAPPGRAVTSWWPFAAMLCGYALIGYASGTATPLSGRRAVTVMSTAIAVTIAIAPPAGAMFGRLQVETKCLYDLPALRALMQVLNAESEPGDIVFTDDWDIFPVYFYLNHRNHYLVGLDPKFSHAKDPVLWERYVCVSRGDVPAARTVELVENGTTVERKINVRLTDIRDHFGARFVIVDNDHRALAKKLDRATGFAERVFPPKVRSARRPPYLLYRVLPARVYDAI